MLTAMRIGSDSSWVQRALRDQPRAFEVLVLRYQKKAHAIARAVGAREASIEDVVQESFLKAFENLPRLRQPDSFGSWFLNIVRNEARRSLRGARSSLSVPLPDHLEAADGPSVEREDLQETLWRKVSELPEAIREAVFLYYHEGESLREVCRALGITRAAALKRLERGRDLLREKLWRDLEEHLRRSIPSEREWTRKARQLAILLMGVVGAAWGISRPAAAAAAGRSDAGIGPTAKGIGSKLLGKVALGGIEMTGKKTAAVAAIVLCTVIGGILLIAPWFDRQGGREPEAGSGKALVRSADGRRAANDGVKASVARGKREAGGAGEKGTAAGPPSILGRVTTRDGRGIEGARIIALSAGRWGSALAAEMPSDPFGVALPKGYGEVHRRFLDEGEKMPRTISGADGAYRIEGLKGGEYRLLAAHDDFLPATDGWALVGEERPARCDLRMAGAAGIAGRVVDEAGRPVGGASLLARPSDDRRAGVAEARRKLIEEISTGALIVGRKMAESAGDGSFRLASLEPVPHDVRVRKRGLASVLLVDVPAGKKDLQVVLSRGLSIRGRILGPDRKPAAGAAAVLEKRTSGRAPPPAMGKDYYGFAGDSEFDWDSTQASETGAEGTFEFTGLGPEGYGLAVRAPGMGPLRFDVRIEDSPVDLGDLLLGPILSIGGRVVDGTGRPVGGARIWIEDAPGSGVPQGDGRLLQPGVLGEARSGPGGEFVLDVLPEGIFAVRASSCDLAPAIVPGIASGAKDLVVVLGKGRTIRGSVADGRDGRPVAGAEVVLLSGALPAAGFPVPEKRDVTGAQGTFEIRGAPGVGERIALRISHPAYGGPQDFPLGDGLPEAPRKFELLPPDRIYGRVVDRDGRAVAGARVLLTGFDMADLARKAGKAIESVLSAKDGSFRIEVPRSLLDGGYAAHLLARHPTKGSGWSGPVKAPGATGDGPELEIVLEPPSGLRGRILDPGGSPIPGAVVGAVRAAGNGKPRGEPARGYSDARGSYLLDGLELGTYEVEVRSPGFAPRRAPEIEVGPEPREEDFTLEVGWSVRGQVVDGDGRGVTGAEVLVLEPDPLDTDGSERMKDVRELRGATAPGILSARTDGRGSYEFGHLEERELTLVARASSCLPSGLVRIRPGESPSDLVLTRLSAVAGRAVEADTGRAVPLFDVCIFSKGFGEGPNPTMFLPRQYEDPAGAFSVDGIPPGAWTVAVRTRGFAGWSQDVSVAPGEEARLEAKLERGTILRGVVVDADSGAPVPGVAITIEDKLCGRLPISGIRDWTGDDGAFAFGGIVPGSYWFTSHHPDYCSEGNERIRIKVGEREPEPLRIALRQGGWLQVKLENAQENASRLFTCLMMTRIDAPGAGGATGKAPKSDPRRFPMELSGECRTGSIPPGLYLVQIEEQVTKPPAEVKEGAPAIEMKLIDLGQVEVRAGETTPFNPKLP
jgi:RNA polymerase sigma factor (sigma-70 family)